MEVGDQKFISLSSDGFALSTDGFIVAAVVVFICLSTLLLFVFKSRASSPSSSICDAIETVEEVTSFWIPKRLDRNQPLKKIIKKFQCHSLCLKQKSMQKKNNNKNSFIRSRNRQTRYCVVV